ncbi:DUF2062 domain-containing protein [Paenibacillus physcomitrellae]|uniref:DUF2062 domain-containing protein n=1 Tax=Paenibacillus physcomitrellae TaxID=1619311 RepID=A0ABQ1FWT6_9BACL|nr:DUF2062 domain-containing protein [Paenibacillus physcomitrellae]GGA31208.1 hypothetical protein GCM10010917_15340 [Paenibacillus physcomitrellae]
MRNKRSFPNRLYRAFKLNFLRLFRTPGGVKKISLGFSIGFGLEMIVISSACLVYLIFYPVVKLAGGSVPAAIIGNVVGKLTFLPIILMPFAKKLGELIYPSSSASGTIKEASIMDIFQGDFSAVKAILHGGLHILIGMSVFGILSMVISYYVITFFHNRNHKRRQAKRRKKIVVSETASS